MADPLTLGLMAGGTLISTVGTIGAGNAQNKAAKFEAAQFDQQAKAETARSSAEAAEEHRQKRLALSRAQLVGASSGGGRAFDLEGDIEREGVYRALTALWEGGERAAGRRMQGSARRYDGRAARRAGFVSGFGTLAEGGARTMLAKYG